MANNTDDFDSDFELEMENGAGVLWEAAIKRSENNPGEDRRKILEDFERENTLLKDALENEWKETVAERKKSASGGGEEGMEVQDDQQLEKPKGKKLMQKNRLDDGGETRIAVQDLQKDFEDAAINDLAPTEQDMAVVMFDEDVAAQRSVVSGGDEKGFTVENSQRFETPRSLPAWKNRSGGEWKTPEDRGKAPSKDVDLRHGRSRSVILVEMANRVRKLEKWGTANEQWLRKLENSQAELEYDVKVLTEKVKDLELKKSDAKEEGRTFSKDELVNHIVEAIGSCTTGIGCSKAYIKKFLNDRYEVPLSQYYGRKVALLLTEGVLSKRYQFDPKHNLYKL